MYKILEFLEDNKTKFCDVEILTDDDGKVSHIYFKDELITYCAIAPHEGTHMHYLLRANAIANFDRWSVAAYQEYSEIEQDIINYLTTYRENIYLECIKDLAYDYKIEFEEREYWQDQYYEAREKLYNTEQ